MPEIFIVNTRVLVLNKYVLLADRKFLYRIIIRLNKNLMDRKILDYNFRG